MLIYKTCCPISIIRCKSDPIMLKIQLEHWWQRCMPWHGLTVTLLWSQRPWWREEKLHLTNWFMEWHCPTRMFFFFLNLCRNNPNDTSFKAERSVSQGILYGSFNKMLQKDQCCSLVRDTFKLLPCDSTALFKDKKIQASHLTEP